MVVTICPPAGTNAINMTVLAHIPDANIIVDSAPSSALYYQNNIQHIDANHKQVLDTNEDERHANLIFSSTTTVVGFPYRPYSKLIARFSCNKVEDNKLKQHKTSITDNPIYKIFKKNLILLSYLFKFRTLQVRVWCCLVWCKIMK